MNKPIAVFDSGFGSYAIVEAIKQAYPQQDVIYFADRKSFPYGAKTTAQLKIIIENSIDFLLEKGASFIIFASNAPSITVLNKIKNKDKVTGIYPPLKDVIKDKKKNTLIIGVKVMIESLELQDYIKQEVEDYYQQFHLENPSPLIQLIESADFLNNVTETENTIRNFIVNCENKFGKLDSITAEVYGLRGAHRAIFLGFVIAVLASLTFLLVGIAPPAPGYEGQAAFQAVLGFVPRIVAASLAGYLVGQLLNAWVLVQLKERHAGKGLWARLLGSTVVGEAADTVLFCLIAFGGILSSGHMLNYIIVGYVFKVSVEVLVLPITYWVIGAVRRREPDLTSVV